MRRVLFSAILVVAPLAFLAGGAWGAVEVCVSDAAALQGALDTAQANGDDDIIKVVQGIYNRNFTYDSSEGYSITLLGGHTSGCASRAVDPTNTVLDGGGSATVLRLNNGNGGDMFLEGFTIQNGTALWSHGGGIYAISQSDSGTAGNVTLTNNIIMGNSATYAGGGIFVKSWSDSGTASNVTLTDNIIMGNTANDEGGGVLATSESQSGAAGEVSLTNNMITGNSGGWYGGIFALSGYDPSGIVTVTNNTISGNTASEYAGGIGIWMYDNTNYVYNNIIWGNTASLGADIYLGGSGTANGYNNDYSDISGSWTNSGNNIDEDPLFVDSANGDYHLQSSSPCIDNGDNDAPELPDTDFEGDPRIIDGDADGTPTVDMGADEHSVPTFCVSNAIELQGALDTAKANGDHDIIKVVQGTYNGNFSYSSSQGYSITLLGGYTSGCASRVVDPSNTVLDGGASGGVLYLYNANSGHIFLEGFTIRNGRSDTHHGGGVYASSESFSGTYDVTLTNNTITGNTATNTYNGGGVYALAFSASGTAGNVILTNNTITGNTADDGGGVYAYSHRLRGTAGNVTLTNNTITGNTAGDEGGGVCLGFADDTINVYSNIIWGNTAPTGGDISLSGTGTANGYNNDYSDISGSWTNFDNNIDANPLFVAADNGDYHLQSDSSCIDNGDNNAPELPDTDFEGDPRIVDGNRDGTATVDMGADEYAPHIDKLRPRKCEPGEKIRIIGYGFGETQGDSIVHIGKRTFDSSSPKIKLWTDTKIRIKVPNYKCKWFKGQDYRRQRVWLTVNDTDSNNKRLKVMKPADCP